MLLEYVTPEQKAIMLSLRKKNLKARQKIRIIFFLFLITMVDEVKKHQNYGL